MDKVIKVIKHKDGYRTFITESGKRTKAKPIAVWNFSRSVAEVKLNKEVM